MKIYRFIFILFLLVVLAAPFASSAFHVSGHTWLVPACPGDPGYVYPTGLTDAQKTELIQGGCGWNEAMQLISSIINFLLFYISLPLAALLFAYAGFLHMTAGGNPGAHTKAWAVFIAVGKGLLIALAAWLIVGAILSGLGVGQEFILLEDVQPNQ